MAAAKKPKAKKAAGGIASGPKDLSKLPPGLRAYWQKKRKATK
jgi:hypothetical protein